MSQVQVGPVYAKVIQDVCDKSQIDFEEGGVDSGTLEKLQSTWQKKLSQLKVAQLPWDPTPAPTPVQQTPPSISSNVSKPAPQPVQNNGSSIPTPPPANAVPAPRIKSEPGTYPANGAQSNGYSVPQMPQFPPGSMPSAQQRAAFNLQQQFGPRAAPQINQLQQQGVQQRTPGLPSLSYQVNEDRKQPVSNFSPTAPQASQTTANPTQTDGAGDSLAEWKAEVARRRAAAAQNPGEGDRLFREHFLEMQQRLEGGGLMLPLEERHTASKAMKRKINTMASSSGNSTTAAAARFRTRRHLGSIKEAQGDAAADDEDESPEADEDAINSDLDDPDQASGDDENEENTDQVMLCTYDKVQRVKSKWKCTLKDGILRVEGNEYVFHKGQGEFEWY